MSASRRRLASLPLLLALAAASLTLAAPVAAKLGMEARLDAPISRDAEAGTLVTVGWTVRQVAGTDRFPYESPGPVFLRLYPMTRGAAPTEVVGTRDAQDPSHFLATIEVPAGGVARVEVGLRNESCVAGTCTRDDWLIALTGDILVAGPGIGAPLEVLPRAGAAPLEVAPAVAVVVGIVGSLAVVTVAVAVVATLAWRRRARRGPLPVEPD